MEVVLQCRVRSVVGCASHFRAVTPYYVYMLFWGGREVSIMER